jgi:hypothetical protein
MGAQVERHFAGRIRPSAERALREHLPQCRACRAAYERHALFAQLDPSMPSSGERMRVGLGLARRRPDPVRIGTLAVCASAGLLLTALVMQRPTEGFVARGPMPLAEPHLLVYRVSSDSPPALATAKMRARDELAFGYQNPTGKKRLLVFGVDEHRHVFWYHPSWTNADDHPVAVAIETGGSIHELTEAISHALDGDQLEIHAVFTDEALSVQDVERRLETGRAPLFPGDTEQLTHLEVQR